MYWRSFQILPREILSAQRDKQKPALPKADIIIGVFLEANRRIQRTVGERRGGASVGAVFLNRSHLYYAVAGDVRIAVLRGEEVIPLSKGQTIDVLAAQAYEDGKISRQDALWSMEEKRVWSYLGQDGFQKMEVCERFASKKADLKK